MGSLQVLFYNAVHKGGKGRGETAIMFLPSQLRPYLNFFKATGSPCQELSSWDNSTSISIRLGIKESQYEDILPVSSTDVASSSTIISLALPPTLSVIHFEMCK